MQRATMDGRPCCWRPPEALPRPSGCWYNAEQGILADSTAPGSSISNNNSNIHSSQYHHALPTMDGLDQFPSLKDSSNNPGPRKNVHIHRDWDRDGHAYRRGPWKIIVGHHFVPFLNSKVYNETNSWWLNENGNWRDMCREMLTEAVDDLIGTENSIFVQYLIWFAFDSFDVGGLQRIRNAQGEPTNVRQPFTFNHNIVDSR